MCTIKLNPTVFFGCNEYETAKHISLKANIPVDEVLWQPIGSLICFRRGSYPIFTKRYEIYKDEKYIELTESRKEKRRRQDEHDQ